MKKIGIIQTATLPGDFPNNLRAIVQGYRECLDRGAELVLAPAFALCGLQPRALMKRRSFLRQQEEAALTLAGEIANTNVPLILGYGIDPAEGYDMADYPDEYELYTGDDELYDAVNTEPLQTAAQTICITPCMLYRGNVRPLSNDTAVNLAGKRCFVTTVAEEVIPEDDEKLDFIIHMPTTPWNYKLIAREDEIYSWETHTNGTTVISLHDAGAADEDLYAGGCAVYRDGRVLARLPFCEAATRIINLKGSNKGTTAAPDATEMMQKALELWLRHSVLNNGYRGVCIPMDFPNSALLTAMAISALGAASVEVVSFEGKENGLIATQQLQTDKLLAAATEASGNNTPPENLETRLRGCLLSTLAEAQGKMVLSPLDRAAILLGEFTPGGETGGILAPLGNLYRMDTYLLSKQYSEQYPELFGALTEPPHPEQDRIIHDLTDRNIGASDLLSDYGSMFREDDVRRVQRRTTASALKRHQLPLMMQVAEEEEVHRFPITHRLND